jgi:hypothetical protein
MVWQNYTAWFGKNGGAETAGFPLEITILRRKTTALFGTMMSQVRVLSPRFLRPYCHLNAAFLPASWEPGNATRGSRAPLSPPPIK